MIIAAGVNWNECANGHQFEGIYPAESYGTLLLFSSIPGSVCVISVLEDSPMADVAALVPSVLSDRGVDISSWNLSHLPSVTRHSVGVAIDRDRDGSMFRVLDRSLPGFGPPCPFCRSKTIGRGGIRSGRGDMREIPNATFACWRGMSEQERYEQVAAFLDSEPGLWIDK